MWQMVANGLWEIFVVPGPSMGGSRTERWSRLSEQSFRVDKWSVCRG
jgi:hypothetical protein